MKLGSSVLLLALFFGLTITVSAAPSLLGPTGLVLVPTAEVLAANQFNIGIFSQDDVDFETYTFNYGISGNLEAGFTRLSSHDTVVNAKYVFQQETAGKPAIAAGVMDITDQINTTVYVVGSKTVDLGKVPAISNFRVHLGLGGGGDKETSLPLDSFFGGVSFDLAKPITVMVEHDGNNINLGGRLRLAPGILAHAAFVGEDSDLIFGGSYTSDF